MELLSLFCSFFLCFQHSYVYSCHLVPCLRAVGRFENLERRERGVLKFIYFEKATKFCKISTVDLTSTKGIAKSFFGVFNFLQKTNKNMSHSSKNEFIHSVFCKNSRLENSLSKLTDL